MDSTQNLCSNCGKCFSSIAKLKKHTKQVHDLSPVSCKECGKRCFGKMQLDTHIKSHQSFSCGTCLKTVPKNSRSLHKVQCKGLALDCNVCAYSTVRPDLLKLHMKKHMKEVPDLEEVPEEETKKETPKFPCKHCGQIFAIKKSLKVHLSVHTGENRCNCSICGKSVANKANLERHMNSQHVNKVVKTNVGFGVWNNENETNIKTEYLCSQCDYSSKRKFDLQRHTKNVHMKVPKVKLLKCDKCDYTSRFDYHVRTHMENVKHTKAKEMSRSTKYRILNNLKSQLNCRIQKKEDPQKVFGPAEVVKLLEDCRGSVTNILKIIKWMRSCFGRKSFAPNIKTIIQSYLHRLDKLHEAEFADFKLKEGNQNPKVIARVGDLNCFIEEIKEARNLVNPQLILGADGSVDKCIVTGIIVEKGEIPDDENVLAKFKATGQQRVFVLAEASGVPENRENVEILLNSLNLPLLTKPTFAGVLK